MQNLPILTADNDKKCLHAMRENDGYKILYRKTITVC